jgi:stage II sporulation protein AA (anti-sigma F factor antagonist)
MVKDVTLETGGEALIARLPSDIDHHSARRMREAIDAAMAEGMPKRVVLDFSDVVFMDSSGIGLVIGRVERARKYGATVELVGPSDGIMRLMRICGIEKISDLYIR